MFLVKYYDSFSLFDVLFPLPNFGTEIKVEEWEKYRRNDGSLNLIKIFLYDGKIII